MVWDCKLCTFNNAKEDFLACEVCGCLRDSGERPHMTTRIHTAIPDTTASHNFKEVTDLVIPLGTISVGEPGLSRFTWFGQLGVVPTEVRTVEIPASAKVIRRGIFRGCTALVGVVIPSSVDEMERYAFTGCTALKRLDFQEPSGLKFIPQSAFSGCVALTEVTIPRSIQSIHSFAFVGCDSLISVTMTLASITDGRRVGEISALNDTELGIGCMAFGRCNASLVLDLGTVSDADEPNRHSAIQGWSRRAALLHKLPNEAGHCIVEHQWPSSPRPSVPGPATLVDGAGIVQPLQLQTLAGDEYPVYGCWGKAPVAHPDFKRLAAEQHPEALGVVSSWGVLPHNTDVPTHTLDLLALGNMLVRGEFDLGEPVLIVWTELEPEQDGEAPRSEVFRAAASAAPTDVPPESDHREYKRARVEA